MAVTSHDEEIERFTKSDAQAKIFWEQENYNQVNISQSVEFCNDHDVWR